MATIYQLKKHLQNQASMEYGGVFLNYLQCYHEAYMLPLDQAVMEGFYLHLMKDLTYRPQKAYVLNTLCAELQSFFKKHRLDPILSDLKKTLDIQMIAIENKDSFLKALSQFYSKENQKVRVFPLDYNHAVVLIMKQDGCLEVVIHPNSFIIKNGRLEPLPPDGSLFYNSNCELEPLKNQFIPLEQEVLARFQVQNHGIEMTYFSKKDLSKISSSFLKNYKEDSHLFKGLKKVESLFIQPQSDPEYKKLIQSLQSCYQLLISGQNVSEVSTLMKEAKEAISHFYPKDRLLLLLVANIENRLMQKYDTKNLFMASPSKSSSNKETSI